MCMTIDHKAKFIHIVAGIRLFVKCLFRIRISIFFFLVFGFALARSATVFCLKRFSIAFEMVGVFKGANE